MSKFKAGNAANENLTTIAKTFTEDFVNTNVFSPNVVASSNMAGSNNDMSTVTNDNKIDKFFENDANVNNGEPVDPNSLGRILGGTRCCHIVTNKEAFSFFSSLESKSYLFQIMSGTISSERHDLMVNSYYESDSKLTLMRNAIFLEDVSLKSFISHLFFKSILKSTMNHSLLGQWLQLSW